MVGDEAILDSWIFSLCHSAIDVYSSVEAYLHPVLQFPRFRFIRGALRGWFAFAFEHAANHCRAVKHHK